MDEPRATLSQVFGFQEFRPGQERVIAALLAGRSALAVFPTGGGKSLCYQLPALLLDGLTVVVSPLIALMKDQVDALTRRGIAAARLDSSLETSEAREVYTNLRDGRLKLLYVSPERLSGERLVDTLARRGVACLAIDEAHCISEWGHNFRPEYLKLASLAVRLQAGRVLALTATATPAVISDIARALGVAGGDIVVTGFERPNLELRATPCRADDRFARLRDRLLDRPPGPTVVYVTLQRTAEEIAAALVVEGFDARPYHAGLSDEVRHQVQDWFLGATQGIVVATIAFGMGIDKPDIRAVYHFNLPKTLENYAQELGRAGRDGAASVCEVFAAAEDVVTLENFSYSDTPTPESIAGLLDDVLGGETEFDVSLYHLSGRHDIRPLVAQTLLTYLELEGVIAAVGTFFAQCKIQFLDPVAKILDRFDSRRSQFLSNVFAQGRQGPKWLTIDTAGAASAVGSTRERVVKALNYLEEQGHVVLQPSGWRQGYRRLDKDVDRAKLIELMSSRFRDRETRDVARVHQVLDYCQEPQCLTRRLLAYFGEDINAPCGHCARCLGESARDFPVVPARPLGVDERALVHEIRAEEHRALSGERALARFLAGLSSPATTGAKLTKHRHFGALKDVAFLRILAFVGEA